MAVTEQASAEPWVAAWAASKDDPFLFATKVLPFVAHHDKPIPGRPHLEAWQDQFLRDFFLSADGWPTDEPRHSVRSGHGVGKTTVIAILALWFVLSRWDSKTVITASSQDQLRDGAWAELRKWHGQLPPQLKDQLSVGEEKAVLKAAPEMGFVVRRTASVANPEALQGIHAEHVLYLVDEASGIADIVFETAAGSLSTKGAIACLFSNPTRTTGFFHKTHHILAHKWRTMRVSSKNVPRARGHIDDIVSAYGEDSNKYRVRVMGEFPTADADTVIPLDLIRAAVGRVIQRKAVRPVWGVDVARFGDDASALVKRVGNVVIDTKQWRQKDTMQLVGLIFDEWSKAVGDDVPFKIAVDVIGLGSGVVDRLLELGLPAQGINVAESPAVQDKYVRLRDELWWKGRNWFETRDVSLPLQHNGIVDELAAPYYDFTSAGKVLVESKREMRERGLSSPNIADAFLLTLAVPDVPIVTLSRRKPRATSPWAA